MQILTPSTIKASEGRFCLVRHSAYNSGTTERVTWRVYEKLAPKASDSLYRLDREYTRKWEALEWLSFVSKF
jgi:hypothetical protein